MVIQPYDIKDFYLILTNNSEGNFEGLWVEGIAPLK